MQSSFRKSLYPYVTAEIAMFIDKEKYGNCEIYTDDCA
jgi:hypothetical protein